MLFLFEVFRENVELTERDCTVISKYFQFQHLSKRDTMLLPGAPCDFLCMVQSGTLRSYVYDMADREFNVLFAYESQWITDMPSYSCGSNSKVTIEAMEKSSVWVIHKDDVECLLQEVPVLRTYFAQISVCAICSLQDRIVNSVTRTAKEHYRQLTLHQGELLMRVPQYQIASYLGITPESLSRIRKEIILENATV